MYYHSIDNILCFINNTELIEFAKYNELVVAPKYIIRTYDKIITTIKKEHELALEQNKEFKMSGCVSSLIRQLLSWDHNDNTQMLVASSYVKTKEQALMIIIWYLIDKKNDQRFEYNNYEYEMHDSSNLYFKLNELSLVLNHFYFDDKPVLVIVFNEFYKKLRPILITKLNIMCRYRNIKYLDLNELCKPIFLEMKLTMDKNILINEFNFEPLNRLNVFNTIFDSIYEINMVKFAGKC